MRAMIFSINQTFQRILASIAQGGSGWSSTPPKFALDQKSPLRSPQRPPVGGTNPVGNHWSRQCGILNISQASTACDGDSFTFFFFTSSRNLSFLNIYYKNFHDTSAICGVCMPKNLPLDSSVTQNYYT
jgi:hypothetical protein